MKKLLLWGVLALASTAGAQVQKWEYLIFTIDISRPKQNDYEVTIVKGSSIEHTSIDKMAQRVIEYFKTHGVKLKETDLKTTMLLNYFGSMGWEMTAVTNDMYYPTTNQSDLEYDTNHIDNTTAYHSNKTNSYYFKRPVK